MLRPDPDRTAPRLRGASAALVAAVVALAGHVSGGGALPHLAGVVLAVTLAGLCGALLGVLGRSRLLVAGSVTVAQGLLHVSFMLATPTYSGMGMGASGDHAAHTAASMGASAGSITSGADEHGAMWLAHVVAAILTMVLFYRGETAIRHLVSVLSLLLERSVLGLLRHLLGLARVLGLIVLVARPGPSMFMSTVRVFPAGIIPALRPLRGPPSPGVAVVVA